MERRQLNSKRRRRLPAEGGRETTRPDTGECADAHLLCVAGRWGRFCRFQEASTDAAPVGVMKKPVDEIGERGFGEGFDTAQLDGTIHGVDDAIAEKRRRCWLLPTQSH